VKTVYRGFTPLNNRRGTLIFQKYNGDGLSKEEERELAMLQTVCGAMLDYRFPFDMTPLKNIQAKADKLVKKIRAELRKRGR
jgi:hypothetical protein